MFLFVFLWPSLLWVSWSREWRGTSALWLQVPKPGWSLLGSKLLAGLTYTVPTLLLVGAWLTGMLFMDLPLNSGSLHPWNLAMLSYDVQMALFVITIIFVANVYISIALVFALTVMKSVQTLVGGWRWLLGLVIGVVFVWGPEALAKWKLYHRLFDFGLFRIQFHVPNFSSATDIKLYAGEILIALVLLGLVFAACSWLFDRRIEV